MKVTLRDDGIEGYCVHYRIVEFRDIALRDKRLRDMGLRKVVLKDIGSIDNSLI